MDKLEFNSSEQEKSDKKRERIIRKMIKVSNKYLRRLNELSSLPYGLDYFINILKRIYVDLEDIDHDEGVMTVGTYCVMVPQELIYASGAIPVKLCSGSYAGFNVGDEITPRDSCPLVKSVAGFYAMDLLPMYKSCSLTIVPTTCDCKKKMAYLISNYKDVIMLHVPTLKNNDESKENFLNDLYM
ncbi:MAG TPA: 2-hydroxyacyl-CoA dehydratase family protein, partial [Clostridia bacterium]